MTPKTCANIPAVFFAQHANYRYPDDRSGDDWIRLTSDA
jgi:hypothetical protein